MDIVALIFSVLAFLLVCLTKPEPGIQLEDVKRAIRQDRESSALSPEPRSYSQYKLENRLYNDFHKLKLDLLTQQNEHKEKLKKYLEDLIPKNDGVPLQVNLLTEKINALETYLDIVFDCGLQQQPKYVKKEPKF